MQHPHPHFPHTHIRSHSPPPPPHTHLHRNPHASPLPSPLVPTHHNHFKYFHAFILVSSTCTAAVGGHSTVKSTYLVQCTMYNSTPTYHSCYGFCCSHKLVVPELCAPRDNSTQHNACSINWQNTRFKAVCWAQGLYIMMQLYISKESLTVCVCVCSETIAPSTMPAVQLAEHKI